MVGGRTSVSRWYAPRASSYPWRRTRDPYAVLVSEVMLQQTQAARVVSAFVAFLDRFPALAELAAAGRNDVLTAWDGLGYNRRAVALSDAARRIVADHGGAIPSDPAVLRTLPGIGPYTASAVASIAFDVPVAAVDTNVGRIVARAFLGSEAHEVSRRELGRLADAWLDRRHPGEWNQALMDLGREVCRPRPRCGICPLRSACAFARSGREPSVRTVPRPPFRGSLREVRGAVVRTLRGRAAASLGRIANETGFSLDAVALATDGLARDGLVRAGPAAVAGRPRGRARLAD